MPKNKSNFIYPLPWLGGKRRIVHRFLHLLTQHMRPGVSYTEPFAGGAAVALTLLDRLPWADVWLNDVYRPVYAFWKTIRDDHEFLIDKLYGEHCERDKWEEYHQSIANGTVADLKELGWRLCALHAWSYGQKGVSFNPRCGSRAKLHTKEQQYRNAHRLLRDAKITNLDFRQVLKDDDSVLYCDPPYVGAARRKYYAHGFTQLDHLMLRDIVLARQSPWLMSYDDHPAIWNRYKTCRIQTIVFGRGLGGPTRFYKEVLITPHIQ
ncbi:D12 class N6 adenine-specific DNA methyltransferase [Gemmata obscuriglobus]|uniref:site-specific DNA-methyltransferase (adenine-specific) n=1 Tax=Gemmata obscuriglobus TaxID=114 RepID=A0A2Z3H8I5_9BACT|nr:DNA adenine methylase [Gemmata obscuriglobus]AWM39847.1 hypothetical protein C1280_24450 [Gemmata obscuriglobus]QEG27029.1 D12 class N6 adenine-specific DNA methyltransferase [Gemmata obscuriglobus]VTS03380.1 d12 class n6 adenine-specific dna methyltransferase : DNA-methyltransferase OS=Enterobacter aerogenes EA1509E PE=4 SV=1: MethyltransfD12 [Gemmata obscuriglobus UQM 2246]